MAISTSSTGSITPTRRPCAASRSPRTRAITTTTGNRSTSASARTGAVDERASSHHGYNYAQSVANAGSDVGSDALREAAEAVGARPHGGWGPETHAVFVSGGSHAGNAEGFVGDVDRIVPGRRVHLVPLEPVAAAEGDAYRFAVTPPWRKKVWRDPEATGTD